MNIVKDIIPLFEAELQKELPEIVQGIFKLIIRLLEHAQAQLDKENPAPAPEAKPE